MKKVVDFNFDMTLNAILMEHKETKEEAKERIEKQFKLPSKK